MVLSVSSTSNDDRNRVDTSIMSERTIAELPISIENSTNSSNIDSITVSFEMHLTRKEKVNIYCMGIIAGFGGFLFGYNTAVIAGALSPLTNKFDLDAIQQSLVVSVISLGSLAGCIIGGYISDKIGRWKTMAIQDILFLIAAILLTTATNVSAIYLGRILAGFGAAFSIVGDIPYLNELAPAKYRGRLSAFYEISVVLGTVGGSISCLILLHDWRVLFSLPIAFVVIHSFFLSTLPESPRWLVQNRRRFEAKESLCKIFLCDIDDIRLESELLHIETIIFSSNTPSTSRQSSIQVESAIADLKPLTNLHLLFNDYGLPLGLVVILMFLSQFTGSVVIRNFAPTIFEDAGFDFVESLTLNLIVSIVNCLFVIFSSTFLDNRGRKTLLLLGIAITIIGTFILSVGFFSGAGKVIPLYLTSCLLTTIGYSVGFGTIGWLLSSELFPTVIRGKALAISTVARNACEFITNFLFLLAVNGTGAGITFAVFCFLGFLSFLFVTFFVVETKRKEPHEILHELQRSYYSVFGLRGGSDTSQEESRDLLSSDHQHSILRSSLISRHLSSTSSGQPIENSVNLTEILGKNSSNPILGESKTLD